MSQGAKYFALSVESLRPIGTWAADCAARALPIFEAQASADSRPRDAIAGIRKFAEDGKRTKQLRLLATAANAAAREVAAPAAAAAARAAGHAAASAYTHPLVDVRQTKHILGAAAYAALALELNDSGNRRVGDEALRLAIDLAPPEAAEILRHMPAREPAASRLEMLLYELDAKLRARSPT